MSNVINTKEYRTAMIFEDAINDYSWSPQKFAESVGYMHKTNQQALIRTLVAVIKKVGADDYNVDLRNKASHKLCCNIVNSGLLDEISLPLV